MIPFCSRRRRASMRLGAYRSHRLALALGRLEDRTLLGNGFVFYDAPELPAPFNPGAKGQETFLTQLTGVFGGANSVIWGGIEKTNFTWVSNAVTNSGVTGYESVPPGQVLPPVTAGGCLTLNTRLAVPRAQVE
jgi:hypothetical protein